jgi:hypothetical protein
MHRSGLCYHIDNHTAMSFRETLILVKAEVFSAGLLAPWPIDAAVPFLLLDAPGGA